MLPGLWRLRVSGTRLTPLLPCSSRSAGAPSSRGHESAVSEKRPVLEDASHLFSAVVRSLDDLLRELDINFLQPVAQSQAA